MRNLGIKKKKKTYQSITMCETYLNPNSNKRGWEGKPSKTGVFDINELAPMFFICNNGTAYVFKFLSFRDTYLLKNLGM